MSKVSSGQSIEPMSSYERLVSDALLDLTNTYELIKEPAKIMFDMDDLSPPAKYKPDFEITNSSGKKLYIEVKSEHSMSLPNMVNFVKIDKAIRRDLNKGFLILVIGESTHMVRFATRPEFKQLHIRYAKDRFEVLDAVKAEFNKSFE